MEKNFFAWMFQSEQKAAVAFTWASKIEMEQQRYRECLSVTRAYNYCQVQPLSKVFSKTSTTEEEHCALFAREGRKWLILVPRGHVLFQIVEEMIRDGSLLLYLLSQTLSSQEGNAEEDVDFLNMNLYFQLEFSKWLDVFTVSYDAAPQVQLKYVSSVEFKIET